jgi:hypothetical protein
MRVLNKRYWPYVVELKNIDSLITDPDPRQEWLEQNVKNGFYKIFGFRPTTYAFRHQRDAVMFALKWS